MSKILKRGRVTIPKAIRDEFDLIPGTEVEFINDGYELRLRKVRKDRPSGEAVIAHLREAGKNFTMTTDEIMNLTRGED